MNQVLSQAEVDALLNAVAEDPAAIQKQAQAGNQNASSGKGKEWATFDLTNQDRVIRGKMPTLDLIYERFVRLFRMSLSNSLRKISAISHISTDLLKFGEFVNTLPIPSCMCIMRFESLRGPALLVLESKLCYALIDSYFGGTDRPYTKVDGKEFTRIELLIMTKVLEMAIRDMEEAWAPVHKTQISMMRMEVNPQFVGVVPPTEVIISTTFEVELENATGTLAIVIPYSTIEPIKGKLSSTFQVDGERVDKVWLQMMEDHIRNLECNVKVNLGETMITMSDLVNLDIGDIIPLNQDVDGELNILVESVSKFKCLFGASRGNRAVQVTRTVED